MNKQDRLFVLGIFVGLGLALISMALPLAGFDVSVYVYRALLFAGLFILVVSSGFLVRDLGFGSAFQTAIKMWPQLLMLLGVVAFALGLTAYLRKQNLPKQTSASASANPELSL